MTVEVTLMMGCRIGGNDNSAMLRFLHSLTARLSDKQQVELLIKFDDDDDGARDVITILPQFEAKMPIRHIITPRGAGYGDLHKAYADLYYLASPESKLFWVLSDDIELLFYGDGFWDDYILSLCRYYSDGIFVLHPRELLPYQHQTMRDVLESPDPYPAWSRQWILTQGGFGPTFSTDGWTGLVEHALLNDYKVDRRIFMEKLRYKRYECAADMPGSERFNGIRRITHDRMLSENAQQLKKQIAINLCNAMNLARFERWGDDIDKRHADMDQRFFELDAQRRNLDNRERELRELNEMFTIGLRRQIMRALRLSRRIAGKIHRKLGSPLARILN